MSFPLLLMPETPWEREKPCLGLSQQRLFSLWTIRSTWDGVNSFRIFLQVTFAPVLFWIGFCYYHKTPVLPRSVTVRNRPTGSYITFSEAFTGFQKLFLLVRFGYGISGNDCMYLIVLIMAKNNVLEKFPGICRNANFPSPRKALINREKKCVSFLPKEGSFTK